MRNMNWKLGKWFEKQGGFVKVQIFFEVDAGQWYPFGWLVPSEEKYDLQTRRVV